MRPDVFEWIQSRLAGRRGTHYVTPADLYYANSRLSDNEKKQDARWDAIVPRSLAFKRFFRLVKPGSTAVQMVEAMRECNISSYMLETLPEAILVPLQDAISLCQPHPPASWSKDLLELVNRSDISLILAPKKQPRTTTSSILVGYRYILPYNELN